MFRNLLPSMYLYFVCKDENETHTQNKYDLSKVSESKWRIQVTGDIEEGYNSFKGNFVLLHWFGKENYLPLSLKMENNIYHH